MKLQTFIVTCPKCETEYRFQLDLDYSASPVCYGSTGFMHRCHHSNSEDFEFQMILDKRERRIVEAVWIEGGARIL